ncbi:hypothetical protein Tco_0340705 [Tanacetum coccineum]
MTTVHQLGLLELGTLRYQSINQGRWIRPFGSHSHVLVLVPTIRLLAWLLCCMEEHRGLFGCHRWRTVTENPWEKLLRLLARLNWMFILGTLLLSGSRNNYDMMALSQVNTTLLNRNLRERELELEDDCLSRSIALTILSIQQHLEILRSGSAPYSPYNNGFASVVAEHLDLLRRC